MAEASLGKRLTGAGALLAVVTDTLLPDANKLEGGTEATSARTSRSINHGGFFGSPGR